MPLLVPEPPPAVLRLPDGLRRTTLVKTMELARRKAPEHLKAHALFVHRNDHNVPLRAYRHHDEWVRVLEDKENYPWLGIVAPPGYAKTTWGSYVFPTWELGRNPALRVGLVANSAALSWGLAGAIKEAIESEPFQLAYPETMPDYDRGWRHNEFFLTKTPMGKDPALAAMGIKGAIQGRRMDLIILDDPTTFEQAQSPALMNSHKKWLKNTLLKRLPAGLRPPANPHGQARVVVVFTRWGPNDLHDTLVDMGFKILHMPALGYWDAEEDDEGRLYPGHEALWPEAESQEYLEDLREKDELTFELVMQGNPNVLGGDLFDPEWWADKRGRPPLREDFDRVITFWDTASGKDQTKGDFVCGVTVGRIGTDIWILDVVRGRLNSLQQEDAVLLNYKENQPDLVCIEDVNEGTSLGQHLVSKHTGMALKMVGTGGKDKSFRASPLAGAYRQGHVNHAKAPWNMPYEAELMSFPGGEHDDQVDAAAGAYNQLSAGGVRVAAA